ncbi:MAG: ABC transporter permease [Algicola sp.]|nr:ABC transporter permease [Algicola sp.]
MNATQPTTMKLLPIYWLESKMEVLKMIRSPGFAISSLMFPVMFYTFFGLLFTMSAANMSTYMLATYGTFGVIGPALMSFGVGVSVERGQGWFDVKEASPMPASAYIVARIAVSLVFSTAIILCLFTLGATFGGVSLLQSQWLLLALVLMLGSLPFCAIGLAMGLSMKSSTAPAVVNLTYLPMSFLSGLWVPINAFPESLQTVAHFMPPFHLAQLALKTIDMDIGGNVWLHLGALLAYGLIFFALAAKAYSKKDKS